MAEVIVENLTRNFGAFVALKDISFRVEDGQFLTLLGPSGCGKSTTLTALAGLDRPSAGRISIGSRVVFDTDKDIFIDAQFRNLGLMFQSYALWPHMTVYKNLDFTLELRRIRGQTAKERIREALALVDMETYAERYPGELSGGQQQRVALARTLVYRPEILLLDEPLSNLDAKLRERARIWLGELQRRTGVTTIYVTHDQAEALAMSDRIIVMEAGKIAQIGTPHEIYEHPANAFVADFVGASNLLRAQFELVGGVPKVRLEGGPLLDITEDKAPPQGSVTLAIRPERIEVVKPGGAQLNRVAAQVVANSYLGSRNLLVAEIGSQQVRVETNSSVLHDRVELVMPPEALSLYPAGKS
ncbi:ABC transporter ATP-binding protein [Pseudochelatococcus sp. B33]